MDVPVKGNTTAPRGRVSVSPELDRIADLARQNKEMQFFSLAHLLTEEALMKAYERLRKDAAAGVDGVTHKDYRKDAPSRIADLHGRMKSGRYRAEPLRRIYIPKEDGKERPISIPSLEDKIAQKATVTVLNAIYEQDFLECSYGFREGRSAHSALDEVRERICHGRISWVLEADIVGYFDAIVRSLLMELIEKRVRDGAILRLIKKWIHVGVIDNGELLIADRGTGQGQITSPLLANIYLHYVLDTWFENEVRPQLRGDAYEVRYADDFVICFQYRSDAARVKGLIEKRFAEYGLELHPKKTRLISFGRFAIRDAIARGDKKPETFDFLGFTHICAVSRAGKFTIHVSTMKKRLCRGLKEIARWCKAHRHDPVGNQCRTLNQKLSGHYQYYGIPTNYQGIERYYKAVKLAWKKWLERRTRGKRLNWTTFKKLLDRHPLKKPKIMHAWKTGASPR